MNNNMYPPGEHLGCSVCVAPQKVYTRWGSSTCAGGSQFLYTGIAAGSYYTHTGAGYNTLCLHSEPQPSNQNAGNLAYIYGTEYEGGAKSNQDAACAVCTAESPGDIYTQWGRSESCTNGHSILHTGIVMTELNTHQKSEFVCVDAELAVYGARSCFYPNSVMFTKCVWITLFDRAAHCCSDPAVHVLQSLVKRSHASSFYSIFARNTTLIGWKWK
jgi:hypothetical protein